MLRSALNNVSGEEREREREIERERESSDHVYTCEHDALPLIVWTLTESLCLKKITASLKNAKDYLHLTCSCTTG